MEKAVWNPPSLCRSFLLVICGEKLEGPEGQPDKTAGGNGTDVIRRTENAGTEVSDGSGLV